MTENWQKLPQIREKFKQRRQEIRRKLQEIVEEKMRETEIAKQKKIS